MPVCQAFHLVHNATGCRVHGEVVRHENVTVANGIMGPFEAHPILPFRRGRIKECSSNSPIARKLPGATDGRSFESAFSAREHCAALSRCSKEQPNMPTAHRHHIGIRGVLDPPVGGDVVQAAEIQSINKPESKCASTLLCPDFRKDPRNGVTADLLWPGVALLYFCCWKMCFSCASPSVF